MDLSLALAAEQNHLSNFGRQHHQEYLARNYFKFVPTGSRDVQEIFLAIAVAAICSSEQTICAVFVEGILGQKLFQILSNGSGDGI